MTSDTPSATVGGNIVSFDRFLKKRIGNQGSLAARKCEFMTQSGLKQYSNSGRFVRWPQKNIVSDTKTPILSPLNYWVANRSIGFLEEWRLRFYLRRAAGSWTLFDTEVLNAPQHPTLNNLWAASRTKAKQSLSTMHSLSAQSTPRASLEGESESKK